MSQTQLRWSLLRHESRAAVLPPSSGAARQRIAIFIVLCCLTLSCEELLLVLPDYEHHYWQNSEGQEH